MLRVFRDVPNAPAAPALAVDAILVVPARRGVKLRIALLTIAIFAALC